MKKLIATILAVISVMTAGAAFAEDTIDPTAEPVSVVMNGEELTFDVNAFVYNDRTLVPMRGIFEAVGASIHWDEDTRTVVASREKDGTTTFVTLQIDSADAFINEDKTALDVPAVIVNERTFVPLRFAVEALGEQVDWDEATQTVIITTAE